MGSVYLLFVAFLFSFGGTCAKLVGPFFASEYITFFRFFFGVLFLLALKLIKRQRLRSDYRQALKTCGGWLLFGAVSKAMAYWTENYALTHGVSYGNILTQPTQLVFITLISVIIYKERLTRKRAFFLLLCVAGVMLVSWNGRSLSDYLSENLLLTCLFLVSGVFAGCYVLAQKQVAGHMDILDSNLTMFVISTLLAFVPTIPSTASGALVGVRPDLLCVFGLLLFGFNTGIGFYLNAKAIPLVPFYMVPILQSGMAIFAIIWGVLFFHEALTAYLVCGTILFIGGIIGVQLADVKI